MTASPTRTLPFFAFALAWTWLLQLPAVLAQHGLIAGPVERFMPFMGLGALGPLVAAVVLSRFQPGGIRGLFKRALIWRMNVVWYVVALAILPAIYVASVGVYFLFGGTDALWGYPPENAQHVAALFVMPIAEEIGWRGFALPRLQQRYGAYTATMILGACWSAFHIMMFLSVTSDPKLLTISFVNVLVGAVLFTWLYNRTRGSLLLAILLHMGAHLNNPAHAGASPTPLAIFTIGICVVACALLVLDKRAWKAPYPA